MKKLNLGSGLKVLKGWVNVDLTDTYGAQIIHDLEKFPYPFKDNTFDEILMDNVLEHLEDTIKVMKELHRISKRGAIIKIIVPHYSGAMAWGHLTHKKAFGSGSFGNFEPQNWERYSDFSFKVLENRLIWLDSRNWFWIRPIKKIIDNLINVKPYISERFFCYPLGGFDHIKFKLRVIK
jgi:SAM-dependent methyltransferase